MGVDGVRHCFDTWAQLRCPTYYRLAIETDDDEFGHGSLAD